MAGPEKIHGLSSADVRKLRDISKRVLGGGGSRRPPPTRRRRGPGGGGSTIITGLLIATIPADDWLEDCIELDYWDATANAYVEYDPPRVIHGINGDPHQPIRGSETVKVRVWGDSKQVTVDDTLESAMEIFRWSMVQLPGHDLASLQGPYKPADDHASQMGGGDCTVPDP